MLNQGALLRNVIDHPIYLIWWIISDLVPQMIHDCEIMAKLVCKCSFFKDSDYRLKKSSLNVVLTVICAAGRRLTHGYAVP